MPIKPEITLRPHQVEAANYAVTHKGNAILAHPTGSGKTLTGIAAFEALREDGQAERALVVTPASLRENYADKGVTKFTNDDYVIYGNKQEAANPRQPKMVDPDSVRKPPTYGIVSYDMFRKDPEKYLKAHNADTVIFDEVHKIKNDASQTFTALKNNRDKFKNFIGMTASVVSNSPADIVPLVDAMTQGKHRLGSKTSFENRFVYVDKKGNKELRNQNVVRALAAPYVHHVTREEMESSSSAPPKRVISTVEVPMSEEQSDLYRYVIDRLDPITRAKMKVGLGKLSETEMKGIFSKLIKTRQLANSIAALDKNVSLSDSAARTPKIRKLLDDVENHLKNTKDSQVVIHSNLLQGGLDVVEQGLKDRGVAYGKFIGKGNAGITESTRQGVVRDFNSGKLKTMLISSAGGEGLDLPNTTMFASLDGHYNPERIYQAESRGVRAGGQAHRDEKDRKVLINRYVSTLPLYKSDALMNTADLLSPMAAINRYLRDEPVFFNPFAKPVSVDEMIYQIADSKDKANEQLRGLLKKAAVVRTKIQPDSRYKQPGFYTDQGILAKYYNRFGERLEQEGIADSTFLDREQEQLHINKLRQYYDAMKDSGRTVVRVAPKDVPKYQELDTRGKLFSHYMKESLKGSVGLGAVHAVSALPSVYKMIRRYNVPPSRALKSTYGITLPALLGASSVVGALVSNSLAKKPHTTTTMAAARRRAKMTDEELLQLLRGQVVSSEKVVTKDDYI